MVGHFWARKAAVQLVVCACGGQYDWKAPNRIPVIQDRMKRRHAKKFGAHMAPQGMCDNLIDALKLLANQQKDGDSPVKMFLQEESRLRIMDGLRKFFAVDNHAVLKKGSRERNKVPREW